MSQTLLDEIRRMHAMPDSLLGCHTLIYEQRAELRDTTIKLHDALAAEARANARAADLAERMAALMLNQQAMWIGQLSSAGLAKLCKAAGMRVAKRAGVLPSKGSMGGMFTRLPPERQEAALVDLFDSMHADDFT